MNEAQEHASPGRRRAKMICTIGQATALRIETLADAGMDVARINFSHGTHAAHAAAALAVRRVAAGGNRSLAIVTDLAGPKIRVGDFRWWLSRTRGRAAVRPARSGGETTWRPPGAEPRATRRAAPRGTPPWNGSMTSSGRSPTCRQRASERNPSPDTVSASLRRRPRRPRSETCSPGRLSKFDGPRWAGDSSRAFTRPRFGPLSTIHLWPG